VGLNIVSDMAEIQHLTVGQLRQRFVGVFGEATVASNEARPIKRILWREYALAEGDLSERAHRRST